jgi:hypothetical protein
MYAIASSGVVAASRRQLRVCRMAAAENTAGCLLTAASIVQLNGMRERSDNRNRRSAY